MGLLSKVNTLRKSVLIYRGIRYRRGFGVHSPFVYNLISKVIDERNPYYSFTDIEMTRLAYKFNEDVVSYEDRNSGNKRSATMSYLLYKEAISPKKGALLFRLANYFKSKNILQIGGGMGISTLYLTSYSKNVNCVALEDTKEFVPIIKDVICNGSDKKIDVIYGEYKDTFQQALNELKELDLVYFNIPASKKFGYELFDTCVKNANDNTIIVINGIKANKDIRNHWDMICEREDVKVTLDLYSTGIVVLNPKLHKKNYIVYF